MKSIRAVEWSCIYLSGNTFAVMPHENFQFHSLQNFLKIITELSVEFDFHSGRKDSS